MSICLLFKTLAAALNAADLVDALKGKGPFTVFAPTDEAFAKLPAGTVETLLKSESKDQLTAVLTYHVVAGQVPAKQVVDLRGARRSTVSVLTSRSLAARSRSTKRTLSRLTSTAQTGSSM